jgi:hypothetical protein
MDINEAAAPLSRRRALKLGAFVTGGLLAGPLADRPMYGSDSPDSSPEDTTPSHSEQDTIEDILDAEGTASNGIFSVEIDRDDITDVTLHDVPITPSFQLNGTACFQRVSGGQVMLNGDMCLKAEELNPFILKLIQHNVVFQAQHQHMYDFDPMVWFVHYRMVGLVGTVAKALKAALNVTSTPFPQSQPSNPTTPLPVDELSAILGASPEVGADGVVVFNIPRKEPIKLGGITVNPYLNVAHQIAFEPYKGGHHAAAIPDFALLASEVNNVIGYMQSKVFDTGCLYNQETDEQPQLYFSHNFKWGDSVTLAREIRTALNMTNTKFM